MRDLLCVQIVRIVSIEDISMSKLDQFRQITMNVLLTLFHSKLWQLWESVTFWNLCLLECETLDLYGSLDASRYVGQGWRTGEAYATINKGDPNPSFLSFSQSALHWAKCF